MKETTIRGWCITLLLCGVVLFGFSKLSDSFEQYRQESIYPRIRREGRSAKAGGAPATANPYIGGKNEISARLWLEGWLEEPEKSR